MKRHDEGLWREMEIRARNVTQKLALVARGSRKRGLKPPVRLMEKHQRKNRENPINTEGLIL
jgi:uncharacterized ferritin-like protein (DUF455 family)